VRAAVCPNSQYEKYPDDLLLLVRSFTIPWGHGTGFVTGSDATQLNLVGHMTQWSVYCMDYIHTI